MLSSADFFAALRWWAVITALGVLATPLTLHLLRSLPDRGYAFTKMVGLLVSSFVFWLLGSLGFFSNSLGGILIGLAGLLALSAWASTRMRTRSGDGTQDEGPGSARAWLNSHRAYVATVELLFFLVFFLWAWVRSQNPAIAATEKPMEIAFLNSLGRSPGFPPLDPWLSGYGISYYYLGYLMTSLLARLAAVPEAIAFNLAIAWLTAGTALGAFGLAYNLIAADRRILGRWAVILGLVAAIAVPLAGNLEVVLEVMHANDIGSDQFWRWLDIRDLNGPPATGETPRYESSGWWWWRSSRVIHEYYLSGRAEEGLEPIAEFPAFSFVLGDLHAHVLALPFAFVGLAVAMAWWLKNSRPLLDFAGWFRSGGLGSQLRAIKGDEAALLLFTAVILGGLSFLNTWDVLIHLFVVAGAFALAQWRIAGHWHRGILRQAVTFSALLVILVAVLYLPFFLGLRSQAAPPYLLPMAMKPTRLAQFLVIFGLPLVPVLVMIASLLVWMIRHRSPSAGRPAWTTAVSLVAGLVLLLLVLMIFLGWLIATTPEGMNVLSSMAAELGLKLPAPPLEGLAGERIGWALTAIGAFAPRMLQARLLGPLLILALSGLLVAVIYLLIRFLQPCCDEWELSWPEMAGPTLPFALLMIGTAALLTLGPEFVYLRDNFGQRINTIFKFYYQAWILFGVVALYALAYLLSRFRLAGIVAGTVYGSLLAASLLFPYFAVQSRAIEYRGPVDAEQRQPSTLDGLAYVRLGNPDEFEAITWLRENADGSPVLVEAVGGQYSQYGRISADTGIPTLLGWAGHELQWRGVTSEPAERDSAVRAIYSQPDWTTTSSLLLYYGVSYVYVGQLERNTYDPLFEDKFESNMEIAFQNDTVTIYEMPGLSDG
jgi:YYY domain-containing protein